LQSFEGAVFCKEQTFYAFREAVENVNNTVDIYLLLVQ